MTGSRFGALVVAAVTAVAVVVVLSTTVLPGRPAQAVNDLGQLVGALTVVGTAWWTARRRSGADRLWRWLLGAAMASWSAAQVVWTWDQVVRQIPVPDSLFASVGYLGMPVLACAAVAVFPTLPWRSRRSPDSTAERRRERYAALGGARRTAIALLDGAVFAGTLLLISWTTTLHTTVATHDPRLVEFVVAVAQPVMDLVLVVLVVVLGATTRTGREITLLFLTLGLASLAVSDSAYTWLVSTGAERFTPLADAGFVAGPVLLALGVLAPARPAYRRRPRWVWWTLTIGPYLPVVGLPLAFLGAYLCGGTFSRAAVIGGVTILLLGVIRQFITLSEYLRLLQRVNDGQRELRRQAFHDPLTGLPNRALFQNRLDHAVELNRRDLRPLALLFLDLDDLKTVNDSLGHAAGDELLRAVAERLRGCLRAADTLARLGGDEFAILLESDLELPESVGDRILSVVRQPITLAGRPHRTTISIGLVAADPADAAVSGDELLRRADRAMYVAKQQGKGFMVAYAATADSPVTEERVISSVADDLRRDPGVLDLQMRYQLIVRLADGTPAAIEAFPQWTHPAAGTLPGPLLTNAVLRAGVAVALDERVLDRACADVAELRAGAFPDLAVHVNLGADQLLDDRTHDAVAAVLARRDLPGTALVLEVATPDVVAESDGTRPAMNRLRRLGVRLVLDGLGTRAASLTSLHQLPFDLVKLAPTLSRSAVIEKRRGSAVRAAVIALAEELGMVVVADGIQDPTQAADLARSRCTLGQGDLLGAAVPLRELRLHPAPVGERLPLRG